MNWTIIISEFIISLVSRKDEGKTERGKKVRRGTPQREREGEREERSREMKWKTKTRTEMGKKKNKGEKKVEKRSI